MEMILKSVMDDASDSAKDSKVEVHSSIDYRIYYLYGDINTKNCAEIACDILYLNREDDDRERKECGYTRMPIRLYINSRGGSVLDMWSLIDVIEASTTPVYTYCNGYAMSAAFQIFLAGHKRFMTKNATLMYHQIYCWRRGKYQDLVEDREHMDYLNEQIEKYVLERTALTEEEIKAIREKKKDTYFDSKQALELKIADELWETLAAD